MHLKPDQTYEETFSDNSAKRAKITKLCDTNKFVKVISLTQLIFIEKHTEY